MKLKLNIELNDEKYSVNAIKNDNKYIYNYKDSIITINKEEMTIKIHYAILFQQTVVSYNKMQ